MQIEAVALLERIQTLEEKLAVLEADGDGPSQARRGRRRSNVAMSSATADSEATRATLSSAATTPSGDSSILEALQLIDQRLTSGRNVCCSVVNTL